MSKTRLILWVWLAFALTACTLPGSPPESPLVFSQPDMELAQPEGPASEPNSMVTAYAEAMGIDYAEAERRLTLQAEMSLFEQQIATDDAYFASWMQHAPTFGLVVSFTAPDGEERIRKYLEGVAWADLVTVMQSDITRDELANIREMVEEEATKTGIYFGSGLNLQTGQVRLYTDKVDELRARLEENDKIALIMDRIEFIEELAAPAPAVEEQYSAIDPLESPLATPGSNSLPQQSPDASP